MQVKVITPPAAYPVTLAEAKEWCRIRASDTTQDGVLRLLIGAMTRYAEHYTGRVFVERVLEASMRYFEYDQYTYLLPLPHPPLLEVLSIKYYDINGNQQTYPADHYAADFSEPGGVRPLLGYYWPPTYDVWNHPILVRYRAGYRPSASPTDLTDNSYLPEELRTWISARLCTLYDNRGQLIIGTIVAEIPRAYNDALLDSLMIGDRLF